MGTHKTSRKDRSRRAVSPVIATVILVAIAITVAVAVAYWMGGIAGQYTRFEQIEIQSALCSAHGDPIAGWNITMTLKNTGTRDTTLISLFINEAEVDTYGVDTSVTPYDFTNPGSEWATNMTNTEVIQSGAETVINVYLCTPKAGSALSSGTTVNIKIHSAGGMDFPKLIELT
jgi:flagellin-like protein